MLSCATWPRRMYDGVGWAAGILEETDSIPAKLPGVSTARRKGERVMRRTHLRSLCDRDSQLLAS